MQPDNVNRSDTYDTLTVYINTLYSCTTTDSTDSVKETALPEPPPADHRTSSTAREARGASADRAPKSEVMVRFCAQRRSCHL